MSENGKTVGDGVSRIADVVEHAGEGLSSVASVLMLKGEELLKALGEKASTAVVPAMGMVAKLFDQYIEDERECLKSMRYIIVKEFVAAIVLTLISIALVVGLSLGISEVVSRELDENAKALCAGQIAMCGALSIVVLAWAIAVFSDACTLIRNIVDRRAKVTANTVSTLINQASALLKLGKSA